MVRPDDGVRCYAHILPADQSLCLKITSTPSYLAANRDVSRPTRCSAEAGRQVVMVAVVPGGWVGGWFQMMGSVPMELSAWAPLEGLRRKESVLMGEGSEMGDKVGTACCCCTMRVARAGMRRLKCKHGLLGLQVNVRMSVIGAGCKIGSRVKINGCVIMDNAVIADGWVTSMLSKRFSVLSERWQRGRLFAAAAPYKARSFATTRRWRRTAR